MLKALDDGPIEKLTQLCNEIYNTGYWPKDLKESIFIPIPKKPKATRCQEYRTISIMSQVTKLLLKIVMDRMKMKVEAELDDAQSGFRQGKGTREGLLNLRLICERHLEVQKDVYICFLEYEKAFDRVRHEPLIQCLREIGVDGKDIKIIRNLYWDQTASVRIMSELSDDIRIYGAPFSHLFTELKISPIELKISPIQLKISPIQLKISPNQLEISTNRPI